MKPKISIAMATYNGERYLAEQLASFASQTLLPDELVVCDDGSSDATWEILTRFSESAPFTVRLFRNEVNLGCARNFARVLELAQGEIIFLSDQDDYWFPEKLQAVIAVFESSDEIWVVTNDQELADARLRPSGITTFGQFDAARYSGSYFSVACCTAIRASMKSIYLPLPDGVVSHDGWLHDLGEFLGVRQCLLKVLQYHRRHDRNTSDPRFNPLVRTRLLRRLWDTVNADPAPGYAYRRTCLIALRQRLAGVRPVDSPMFVRIEHELAAIERRLQLVNSPRHGRILPAWQMLRRGDYRSFSGWKSLILDLVR